MPMWLQQLDETALLWIQQWVRQDWLNPLVEVFTSLGNGGAVWIVLTVLLLCRKSTRRLGVASAIAMLLGLICTNLVLKNLFLRPRPYTVVEGLVPLLTSADPNSFPSGHTTAAFAAGIAWAGTSDKRAVKWIAVIQAVCMGLSRLYVGVHYPSDVLAGMVIGTACALLSLYFLKRKPYFLERK